MLLKPIVFSVTTAALAAVLGAVPARASTFDKLTYLTFSGPIRIPGALLTPGTYRFHLTNPTTSRNVIQVLSGNGAIVYSQFHTTPDSRETATDESTVTFKETKADTPPAIHSLFYGGERSGYEFVYPTSRDNAVAEAAVETRAPAPVISEAPRITHNVAPAPIVAKSGPVLKATPVQTATSAVAQKAPATDAKKVLPKTASSLPEMTVAGFASLLIGLGLHARRRVASLVVAECGHGGE